MQAGAGRCSAMSLMAMLITAARGAETVREAVEENKRSSKVAIDELYSTLFGDRALTTRESDALELFGLVMETLLVDVGSTAISFVESALAARAAVDGESISPLPASEEPLKTRLDVEQVSVIKAAREPLQAISRPCDAATVSHAIECIERVVASSTRQPRSVRQALLGCGLVECVTPSSGNCQYYAFVEALSQQSVRSGGALAIEATRALKCGIKASALHAFEYEFAEEVRSAYVADLAPIERINTSMITVEVATRIIKEYLDAVAKSPSELNRSIDVTLWGCQLTLREVCKFMQQPVYVASHTHIEGMLPTYMRLTPVLQDEPMLNGSGGCFWSAIQEHLPYGEWAAALGADLRTSAPLVVALNGNHFNGTTFIQPPSSSLERSPFTTPRSKKPTCVATSADSCAGGRGEVVVAEAESKSVGKRPTNPLRSASCKPSSSSSVANTNASAKTTNEINTNRSARVALAKTTVAMPTDKKNNFGKAGDVTAKSTGKSMRRPSTPTWTLRVGASAHNARAASSSPRLSKLQTQAVPLPAPTRTRVSRTTATILSSAHKPHAPPVAAAASRRPHQRTLQHIRQQVRPTERVLGDRTSPASRAATDVRQLARSYTKLAPRAAASSLPRWR